MAFEEACHGEYKYNYGNQSAQFNKWGWVWSTQEDKKTEEEFEDGNQSTYDSLDDTDPNVDKLLSDDTYTFKDI